MFNSYQELFHGYVNFYRASLYNGPPAATTTGGQLSTNFDTAPVFKAATQGRCIVTLSDISQQRGETANDQRQHFLELAGISAGASNNHSRDLSTPRAGLLDERASLPLAKPRLLLEEDGSRVVMIGSFNGLDTSDLVCIGTIFVVLLLAKRLLSRKLRKLKQIDQLGLRPKDRERLDESLWRLIYYTFSSTWLIYSCSKHNAHLLLSSRPQPELAYDFQLYRSTYAIFMIEAAFYVHATYALVLEDVWRRDSPMMLLHHLAAIFATLGLYATRLHQVGLISIVLRDTCDVMLEVVKLTKCLHIQHGKRIKSIGSIVNCCLSVFALTFALNQLYYYPLFCLYHGLNLSKLYNIQTPVMTGVLTCGLIFLLLDLLWFGLILRLLYYMALAQPMKDPREYDDEDEDIVESEDSGSETTNLKRPPAKTQDKKDQ